MTHDVIETGTGADPTVTAGPTVAAVAAPLGTVNVTPANGSGTEKRSQLITWFLGLSLVFLVASYALIGLFSVYATPQKESYDIITNMQAGLKDFILMVLGGFLGAITQKHA